MKDIVWNDALSVDVEEIDEDHRRLIDLFNILNHSVTNGDSADYIDAILEELICLTIWHFRHEERLMLLYNYDGTELHKSEHQDLIDSVRALQDNFHQKDKTLSEEDIEYLENWLTAHIYGQDMKLGFYLMDRM